MKPVDRIFFIMYHKLQVIVSNVYANLYTSRDIYQTTLKGESDC